MIGFVEDLQPQIHTDFRGPWNLLFTIYDLLLIRIRDGTFKIVYCRLYIVDLR